MRVYLLLSLDNVVQRVFTDHCLGFLCKDGKCLPSSGRCNMLGECLNSEDEANCTCADFLKAQLLHEKICDGVADCWDYSDETDCGIYQSIFQSCFPVVGKSRSIRGKVKELVSDIRNCSIVREIFS